MRLRSRSWKHHRCLKGYKEDKNSLLGQLNILSKSLHLNSIHGIGKEEVAGADAELAIRRFFDYYHSLDQKVLSGILTQELQHELMKLRHCIGVYYQNENKIDIIETCMATRRTALKDAMRGKDALLAQIASKETKIGELIEKDKALLHEQLIRLNKAIESNRVEGYERLPISKGLIEHYEMDLKVYDDESLMQIINGLSVHEINTLMTEEYVINWSKAVGSLENLGLFFLQLSPEKTISLVRCLGEKLKDLYLKKGDDFFSLLSFVSLEQQNILATHLINIEDLLMKYRF